MAFKPSAGSAVIVAGLGLVGCGVAASMAWRNGMWGVLTGAALIALWLCALVWWAVVRPRDVPQPPAATSADADAMVLRVLLDAAPTPLLGIEGNAARALNRAARRLFATDDRILPLPPALADATATHLRHEDRNWRVDRVTVTQGAVTQGAVVALIDIEQEERAAEARATAELIQVLGHELLNGLAPIVSLAESGVTAVERPTVDLALLREILATLARRAEGLQRFTEAYRVLARLPEPTRTPTSLREMADDLARLFAGRWPTIKLVVTVIEVEAWSLDRDQISQALWALLQNAAEAAPDRDAQVTLRLSRCDTEVAIDVEDNGAGIAPDRAARIFRPFHTSKPDGTGVGLSLARQIAQAHGGTLTLEPGRVTLFRLRLPPG